MDVIEYVKQRKRMCDYYVACSLCPAGQCKGCASFDEIPNVLPIVEQWAKEHPVKTRQSELLRLFPEAEMIDDAYINLCPVRISKEYKNNEGVCRMTGMDCNVCKRDFWLKEIE